MLIISSFFRNYAAKLRKNLYTAKIFSKKMQFYAKKVIFLPFGALFVCLYEIFLVLLQPI